MLAIRQVEMDDSLRLEVACGGELSGFAGVAHEGRHLRWQPVQGGRAWPQDPVQLSAVAVPAGFLVDRHAIGVLAGRLLVELQPPTFLRLPHEIGHRGEQLLALGEGDLLPPGVGDLSFALLLPKALLAGGLLLLLAPLFLGFASQPCLLGLDCPQPLALGTQDGVLSRPDLALPLGFG